MLQILKSVFSVPGHKPELINAQVRAFTRQMPILYSVLVCNMLFVATTHFNSAPLLLTVVVPAIGILITVTRLVSWWRLRLAEFPVAHSIKRLRSTIWLAGGIGVGFTAWSLALFSYGSVEQKAHVVFFMAITMVACVFSLMHLRAASFLVASIVITPFVGVLAMSGSLIMYAIAANMVLVTAVLLYMINTHYNDFATMVSQRQTLEQAHQTTLSLNAINDRLANLDTLTGMPNRRRFFARVDDMGTDRCESQSPFAIGLIDLDGFKNLGLEPLEDLLHLVGRRTGQLFLALLCPPNQGSALIVGNLLKVATGVTGQNLIGNGTVGQDRKTEVLDVVVAPANRGSGQPLRLEGGDVVLKMLGLPEPRRSLAVLQK